MWRYLALCGVKFITFSRYFLSETLVVTLHRNQKIKNLVAVNFFTYVLWLRPKSFASA